MQSLIFIGLLLFSFGAQALSARVLLGDSQNNQIVYGSLRISCLKSDAKCTFKPQVFPKKKWQLRWQKQGLTIQSSSKGVERYLPGQSFRMEGSFLFHGKMLSRLDSYKENKEAFWVIHVPLRQYLYGVLSSEVPTSWPMEALKAQAVASRTYFLFKKHKRTDSPYDVRSDVMDQVYKFDGLKHQRLIQAVNDTRGLFLVKKRDGQVFPSYFHADCGGATSSETLVWREPSSENQRVEDPYCKNASKNNWTLKISEDRLLKHLHQLFYIKPGRYIKKIHPRRYEESRSHIIDFVFEDNSIKRVRGNELRKEMGFSQLRSAQFLVSKQGKYFYFKGQGYGHGVGLCQWGAQRWARQGKSFKEILKHYYPQSELSELETGIMQASF